MCPLVRSTSVHDTIIVRRRGGRRVCFRARALFHTVSPNSTTLGMSLPPLQLWHIGGHVRGSPDSRRRITCHVSHDYKGRAGHHSCRSEFLHPVELSGYFAWMHKTQCRTRRGNKETCPCPPKIIRVTLKPSTKSPDISTCCSLLVPQTQATQLASTGQGAARARRGEGAGRGVTRHTSRSRPGRTTTSFREK